MNYNLGLVISKQFDEIKKTLTGRKYPENLIWFLTERCNLKCGHCFVSHKGRKYRDEITYDQINKILNTSKNSLKKIAFTGGEPLLNRDFENIFISAGALPNLKELHVSNTAINLICKDLLDNMASLFYRFNKNIVSRSYTI